MELVPPSRGATVVLGFFVALAALVVLERSGGEIGAAQGMKPAGHPQLVSIQPLPEMDGEICQVPVSASAPLLAGFGQAPAGARVASAETARGASPSVRLARDPVRIIRDLDASFSTVAVDVERDEVVAGAENTFQILVYDRRANTPPGARMTEPKRALGGDRTKIDYICGLHVDPRTGEIYALNDDTETTMSVYSREARGNVPADRELKTPIYTFGLAVDEENEELYMTVQREGAVVVFRKMAAGDEPPLRLLQGDRTRLADPHGIAIDPKNDLMFVTNFGSVASRSTEGADLKKAQPKPNWPVDTRWVIPGSGRFSPASITVYRRTASGDTAPLRAIEGPRTRLNMPAGIVVDPRRGEIFVANDVDHSVLVFSAAAQGDVAPLRVIQGPRTSFKNPTGLFLDVKNDELWVANFGNHTLAVHKPNADGDAQPLRIIRSAPLGSQAVMMGNPGGVAYDTKRSEILVPN